MKNKGSLKMKLKLTKKQEEALLKLTNDDWNYFNYYKETLNDFVISQRWILKSNIDIDYFEYEVKLDEVDKKIIYILVTIDRYLYGRIKKDNSFINVWFDYDMVNKLYQRVFKEELNMNSFELTMRKLEKASPERHKKGEWFLTHIILGRQSTIDKETSEKHETYELNHSYTEAILVKEEEIIYD